MSKNERKRALKKLMDGSFGNPHKLTSSTPDDAVQRKGVLHWGGVRGSCLGISVVW